MDNTCGQQVPLKKATATQGVGVLLSIIFILAAAFVVPPIYNVWAAEKEGQAQYAQAESTRQISVLEAMAKNDSAALLAQAEITRARGVAEANQIIGKSLENNTAYLDYLWLTEKVAQDADKEIIYIPTEAQLPILEAGRRANVAINVGS